MGLGRICNSGAPLNPLFGGDVDRLPPIGTPKAYDRALLSAAGLSNARSGAGTIFPQDFDFGRDSPL